MISLIIIYALVHLQTSLIQCTVMQVQIQYLFNYLDKNYSFEETSAYEYEFHFIHKRTTKVPNQLF